MGPPVRCSIGLMYWSAATDEYPKIQAACPDCCLTLRVPAAVDRGAWQEWLDQGAAAIAADPLLDGYAARVQNMDEGAVGYSTDIAMPCLGCGGTLVWGFPASRRCPGCSSARVHVIGSCPQEVRARVRAAVPADAQVWRDMRCRLWAEDCADEHEAEIAAYFAGEFPRWPWSALLAEDQVGNVIGFAEVSIRSYAEGCTTHRIAYLEGWWVCEADRRRGVGAALVRAAEDWGRAQGCQEFASDVAPDNDASLAAHRALGFEDVGLVRCLRKDL